MDFKKMASKLGFDEADFIELAQLLVTTSQSELSTIEQELPRDWDTTVPKVAHSIKGAAANLGFSQIADMAKEMETLASNGKSDKIKAKAMEIKASLDLIKRAVEGS